MPCWMPRPTDCVVLGDTSAARLARIQGAGSHERTLQTTAGDVNLKVPKLRRQTFSRSPGGK